MIVKAHTSIIGDTGYNCHSRNFFKALDKFTHVQVRNFTVGSTWDGYNNDEPHNKEYYIDDVLKKILVEQTLNTPNGREEFPLYSRYKNDGQPDIHIVLNETDHYYFYDDYSGKKIAYNVWETTEQPENFFERLKTFDQVWVPTEWQKECTIKQGLPEWKVKVVPEGVDVRTFKPKNYVVSNPINRPFRFVLIGRWDYRKATKEIIETFTKTFSEDENVELILSVDNPFASDGMNSTEERLEKFGIKHSGIKVIHHLSKQDYVELLKSTDVFLSCARGEGWNLPLIEAMSCGVPSIYSNWGGQLEFAKDRGIPVNILEEVPANIQRGKEYFSWTNTAPGNFAEPDFNDLSLKMRDSVNRYVIHKKKALEDSDEIREKFTWENAAKIANTILNELMVEDMKKEDVVSVIIARADTPKRKQLLKQCIKSIDTDIILSTNYPVDADVQSMVNHVVFSNENPILLKDEFQKFNVGYFYWKLDDNGEKQYKPFEYEHGYAAYLLTRRGIEFAKTIGKKIIHIINYDYEISKETLRFNEKQLETNDLVLFTHDEWEFEQPAYCSAFITSKLDPLISFFTKYNSKSAYYESIPGFNILELNLTNHYRNSNYTIKELSRDGLRINNKVDQESAKNMTVPPTSNLDNDIRLNKMNINFVDSPFVEITGGKLVKYDINFIDKSTNEKIYGTTLRNNEWARVNRQWFTDWKIEIKGDDFSEYEHHFDAKGKRVFIVFESSSLGDTLAWIPYVEEFRKKHGCHVIVSTFLNSLFESEYPHLEFVNPGTVVHDLYALYRLGCFYDDNGINLEKHKTDFRKLRLQEYATDILGLTYEEIRPRIKEIKPLLTNKPYICIANHSTAQSKYWNNPVGWQQLVDYVKNLGYDVYLLSKEEDGYMGNFNPSGVIKIDGKSLEDIASILLGSNGFVGLGSGLSWYAWALNVPTILISGFSEPHQEMQDVYRIINNNTCHGCFARHIFDRGDWNWCPDHKGTPRQFECTKEITFDMVKPSLNQMLGI